jgi:nucleoside-diphosphate-sugar epimerase
VINIGRGQPILMTEFLDIMEELTGRKPRIKAVPAPASEPKVTFANVDKARRLLGLRPQDDGPRGPFQLCCLVHEGSPPIDRCGGS